MRGFFNLFKTFIKANFTISFIISALFGLKETFFANITGDLTTFKLAIVHLFIFVFVTIFQYIWINFAMFSLICIFALLCVAYDAVTKKDIFYP